MTNNVNALTIGSAEIYLNGEKCGFATDVEIEKRVEMLRHETNIGLTFATDHMLPIRRSYFVRGRFGEIDPPTVNNALGLAGVAAPPIQGASAMVEYPRLYSGRWYTLRRAATGNVALKSLDGTVTYVSGEDYEANEGATAIRLIADGDIVPGKLLKLTYAYTDEPSAEVALNAGIGLRPVHILLVHRYPDGVSRLEVTLPRVVLDADLTFAFDEKEWIGMPFSGEVLPDEGSLDAPFGSQRFYGPVFSVQTDCAADAPGNPYVPKPVAENEV
jgi:hypothetical protein